METIKAFLERWDILGFIVAGFIGAIIMLLIDGFRSLFNMKRKKYCISKALVSSTVYQQTNKDGLKITISYNNEIVDGPLTFLSIRLRNDGEEDLMYSQRISSLIVDLESLNVVDVSIEASMDGVNPSVSQIAPSKFDLKWDLMKRDEYFFICIVVRGEVRDMSGVKFDIRADGINQIKSPEYKVGQAMIPVLGAAALVVLPIIIFYPAKNMFLDIMPEKWLYVGCMIIAVLAVWIAALKQRIKWLKEQ